jgi:hypothetical protein
MLKFLSGILLCTACTWAADTKIENDSVRVLLAVDIPHHKGDFHKHDANRVMIYLDAGDMTLTYQDGHKDQQHWKVNGVAWSAAGGMHTSENIGAAPIRIVEIELKKPAPAKGPYRRRELDPLVIDPAHNVLVFENPQVRVFRSWREAGASEKMHEHAGTGRVAVLLTDLDAQVKTIDGVVSAQKGAVGDAFWSGPVTHSSTNKGQKKFEMVVVEVK